MGSNFSDCSNGAVLVVHPLKHVPTSLWMALYKALEPLEYVRLGFPR